MAEINNLNSLSAFDIWKKLDAKDGSDGKITKSIWDEFRSVIGTGKTINNYITEANAVKSIKYYLKNMPEEIKTKLGSYLGISQATIVNSQEELTPTISQVEPDEGPSEAQALETQEIVEENPDTHTKRKNTNSPQLTADGYIDPSTQGISGDCWLLSGLSALSETQWGRDAIKEAINIKENGDIIITLKGAYGNKKQFKITSSELEAAKNNNKYSTGDIDVLAIELAVEKYRKQFGETLDGGFNEEVFRLITGSHNTQRISEKNNIKGLLNKAKANPEKYAISACFYLGESAGRDAYHAYNVARFEIDENGRNIVVLTNPWDSRREIRITEEEFMKYIVDIEVLANPKGNTQSPSTSSDGKIGATRSARKGTDFSVAPAIHAVAKAYPDIIRESIHHDTSGNFRITLKGVNKTYSVSAKEIAKAKDSGRYTEGDDDIIALEIAMEKYGKEKYHIEGLAEASMSTGMIQAGTEIYGISDTRAIFLLTGINNKYANLDENNQYIIADYPQQYNPNLTKGKLQDMISHLTK